ncbi:MAG: magnesium transporter [Candidatus Cloacimonadota bacterium]|nr:magnesium transporter [Candidatus Cloacimonadota bacterium]
MFDKTYEKISNLIEQKKFTELKSLLKEMHPADIAQIINELPSEFRLLTFRLLSAEVASDVLPELYDEIQDELINKIKDVRFLKILDEMDSDEATDILADLEDTKTENLLKKLDKIDFEDSNEIRRLMKYPEDTAGGRMQLEVIMVKPEMTREQIIEYIKSQFEEVENIHYAFVVDKQKHLLGGLDITKLLWQPAKARAKDIMQKDLIVADVNMDQEQVANLFRKYDLYILPVIDKEGHLLGRITVDDVIDVIDEEASEDAYKMVGLESEDRVFSKPFSSARRRTPWLIINMFTAVLAASVVSLFENTISQFVILAVFMPIVAGMGGNAATQTLTVIVRGIALGELTFRNTKQAIIKEVFVGLINGLVLAIVACLVAYLWKGNFLIGIILGCAMIINMFIAALFGSLVPIIMRVLKIDPALSSAVMVTTLTDIGGFAAFLGLATIFLL